ncbi:tRNA (uracil-5-)-methyltransferase homolog A [Stomoxys calcitrans]|uniref:tRNA (uracil-5-)-methyltransferase homolog A n=1 Tax=Stomoxys calcitrans TaxID=35570 RepID=UPI0027E28FFC|nr:tRNA (uracil-5-)-methyltransferase homolog A [Stomoxys calcitrans]XP_013119288.2 tRNA (uracil-5-)-methyltransferase homolog A [Stomoxys calcitrans]XP_059216182.1 tRNA (uracil-5-)-methyltransferase homolog A [Stomoxys calcitrans]
MEVSCGVKPQASEEVVATEAAVESKDVENSEKIENPEELKDAEFEYLQRNEFTSEIYKIEVRNLGYFGIGEFKKLLKNKLKLDMSKIKSPLRKEFAFVCFRSQADQEKALTLLNGYKWKGKVLQAQIAKASADPLQRKRKEAENTRDSDANKRHKTSAEATCPLASMSYDKQLEQKEADMKELTRKFLNELKKTNRESKAHLEDFKYEGVLASPQVDGYRNKNEFTVGKNSDGEIVVGFRLGSYADGSVEVAEVQSLPHIPEAAKWGASSFQNFVRKSKFQPFNPEANSGHFRQLMVRVSSSHAKEIMLVAGIYSSNLSAEQLEEVKQDLKQYYSELEESGFKCTSLYYQDVKHREAGQMVSPVEHLAGTTHIQDTIHGLNFRISPLAFFQINTAGANVLYQKAIDLANPQPHSYVLDICCGTGTIALSFAKHCKQVLGVEIIPDAIKDAEFNAENNNVQNCKFFAGNADDYIQSMVREVTYGNPPGTPLDVIAVVDPPRAGLHNRSIAAIRAASAITRLVYISCNPQRAQRNWIELGRPESKQYKGDPFFPITAVAVDMFPHTAHTEMVILFERRSSEKSDKPVSSKPSEEKTLETVQEKTENDSKE